MVVADRSVDVTCSRDLDAPVIQRDADAVQEWLKSNKIFHTMRDRNVHGTSILAGLWCFRNDKDRNLGEKLWKVILLRSEKTIEFSKARRGLYSASRFLVGTKPIN